MKIEQMRSIPSSRAEFERNMFFMAEAMNRGKFHVGQGLHHTIDGLQRARKLPNGRLDLLSVDEMTRLNANMMAEMQAMGSSSGAHDPIVQGSAPTTPESPEV
jgi:hypothetical protein